MNRISRLMFVLFLLLVLLPVQGAAAQAPAQAVVNCATVAVQLNASFVEGELGGAKYCVIYPPRTRWNRDLVVFAHGYVFADPANPLKQPEIPWDQAIRGDLNLPGILVNLGYGFAISGYRKDGLAIKEGVQDIVALATFIKTTNARVRRVFLTGASEGGAVTTLALEQNPALFSGGLSTCGPIGDFQRQVNYWGDFRSVFDAEFPGVLKYDTRVVPPVQISSAIYIPPLLFPLWTENTLPNPFADGMISPLKLATLIALNQSPEKTQTLLAATGAPIDPANVDVTTAETVLGLLDYNIQATDEGRRELARDLALPEIVLATSVRGNPYFNSGVVNSVKVDPMVADPLVAPEIAANYQTTGKLSRQLVVMHTTGDPIVPFWHTKLYLKKAIQKGSLGKLSIIPVSRYGHCSFTPAEAVFGFYVMVLRSTLQPFTAGQLKCALPDMASQKEFQALKMKGLDLEK